MDVRIGQGLTIASFKGDISGFGRPRRQSGLIIRRA